MADAKTKSIDSTTNQMIEKAASDGVKTVFDRAEAMKPCPIGVEGSCCSICAMGPCRVMLPRGKVETAEERRRRVGVCGATPETIAARNFLRKLAAGTAAHGDHGRRMAEAFLAVAKGEAPGYKIKDEQKLLQLALDFGSPGQPPCGCGASPPPPLYLCPWEQPPTSAIAPGALTEPASRTGVRPLAY